MNPTAEDILKMKGVTNNNTDSWVYGQVLKALHEHASQTSDQTRDQLKKYFDKELEIWKKENDELTKELIDVYDRNEQLKDDLKRLKDAVVAKQSDQVAMLSEILTNYRDNEWCRKNNESHQNEKDFIDSELEKFTLIRNETV